MLQRNKPNRKSVVESMMDTLEEYVTQLEDKVGTREIYTVTSNLKQQKLKGILHKQHSVTLTTLIPMLKVQLQ